MNTVQPHDLLWGMTLDALPLDAPAWAVDVIAQGQPVVVRRALMAKGRVAVGIRGPAREQRYAASMLEADITRRVSPEQLIHGTCGSKLAREAFSPGAAYVSDLLTPSRASSLPPDDSNLNVREWPALRALEQIRPLMTSLGLAWGVTGSAGFELASGIPALHEGSDLDLILRTPVAVSRAWAADLLDRLESAPCRIDVQLQTPGGAVMLREWAGSARQVLLKSTTGACLVANPWQDVEVLA